jgi:hypothetical protein
MSARLLCLKCAKCARSGSCYLLILGGVLAAPQNSGESLPSAPFRAAVGCEENFDRWLCKGENEIRLNRIAEQCCDCRPRSITFLSAREGVRLCCFLLSMVNTGDKKLLPWIGCRFLPTGPSSRGVLPEHSGKNSSEASKPCLPPHQICPGLMYKK